MALPSWPVTLPPLVAPIGVAKTDELVPEASETKMDAGPDRSRPRSLIDAVPRAMSLRLTRAQFNTFFAFLKTDLVKGTRRFTAPVRISTGKLATRTCRITGKVSEDDKGRITIVTFTLVVFDW